MLLMIFCVLGVFGPKSRDLMKDLSKDDYSNENFKVTTTKGNFLAFL